MRTLFHSSSDEVLTVSLCSAGMGAPTSTVRESREQQTGALKIAWVTSSPNDIIEGKPRDLQCFFSGMPLPHEVHWYKDGELITNETEGIYHSEDEKEKNGEKTLRSTLHLPPGREEQEGFYKCSARNSIPSSASFEIQMIYECPLAKGPTNHSSEIRAHKSSNVSLSCWIDYDDYCPEELLWKLNDEPEPLPESGKKYKVELKDTHTKCQKEFILSIFDVTESDEGTYSCRWLCEYENTTKAAIDLKVVDDLQTGVIGRF
ncbi:neuronal cell adhesion molecule-like isoform X2 [Orbicella faveolata]|uniref:neuronal cell adhesion molecule-like isoform X2 n=1 Tax=Orbicella faveolata TaxID=48498 RepID=UPI0009E263F6|nr:neuronal cell adhesion molecule-like isoform X2 [Orbicella faveolata]XP_020616998.1 neuronal cell adhesion molecule-like isoform X2 [Orbicella faveolata]